MTRAGISVALALLLGCHADRVKGTNMENLPRVPGAAGGLPDRLEYSVRGGFGMGTSGLPQFDTSMQIDLGKREVYLERHQPNYENPPKADPLGTFHAAITPDLDARLRAVLASTDLRSGRTGNQAREGMKAITFGAVWPEGSSSSRFSAADTAIVAELEPLISIVTDVLHETERHPFQAVALAARYEAGTFVVELKNVGTEAVVVPDLDALALSSTGRAVTEADLHHAFAVRIAEDIPDDEGFDWSMLRIAAGKASGRPSLLMPGQSFTRTTVPWTGGRKGANYVAQAKYAFYGEPGSVDGRPMMRGRAFSDLVKITL